MKEPVGLERHLAPSFGGCDCPQGQWGKGLSQGGWVAAVVPA